MEYLKGCPDLQTGVRMIFSSLLIGIILLYGFEAEYGLFLMNHWLTTFARQIHFKRSPCEDIGATAGDAGGEQGDEGDA